MTISLRIFYRKIYVTGLRSIPATGPAIILANHPSSLMDAALIGLLLKRPVWFFTRGDVFVGRWVNFLLAKLHMIPVYSHDEGRNTIDLNNDSYRQAERILTAGGILLFFPEGNSKTDHQLLPLRKGVFRMAFQAAEKNRFSYDIPFIPTGINYEHPSESYTDVMVNFGTPFFLNDYVKEYQTNAAGAFLRLTKDGFAALEKKALHIKNMAHCGVAEKWLIIGRNSFLSRAGGQVRRDPGKAGRTKETAVIQTVEWPAIPGKRQPENADTGKPYAGPEEGEIQRFEFEKAICDRVNQMEPAERDGLQERLKTYFAILLKHGLSDHAIIEGFHFSRLKQLLLLIGAPLFFAGYLLNALPVRAGKWIADKKVYRLDFYSWIFVTTSMLLYILWLLILLIVGFRLTGWPGAAAALFIVPASGLFARAYRRWWKEYIQYLRVRKLAPAGLTALRHLRAQL